MQKRQINEYYHLHKLVEFNDKTKNPNYIFANLIDEYILHLDKSLKDKMFKQDILKQQEITKQIHLWNALNQPFILTYIGYSNQDIKIYNPKEIRFTFRNLISTETLDYVVDIYKEEKW